MLSNSYFLLFAALLGGSIAFYHERIRKRPAKLSILIACLIAFAAAWKEQTLAAGRDPHIPSIGFWLASGLLAILSAKEGGRSLLAVERWKKETPFSFPYRPARIALILAAGAASVFLQTYYLGHTTIAGIRIPWYAPMIAWGTSLYFLLYPLFPKRKKDGGDFFSWRIASLPFAFPFPSKPTAPWETAEEDASSKKAQSAPWANTGALIAVLIAVCLYGIASTSYPTDVHGDEAETALYGLQTRNSGQWNLFYPGWYHIPNLFFLIPAWGMWLFGDNLLGMRMTGAMIGVACVPVFYLLARRFLLPKAAALAALMFASSSFIVHFSRMGTGYNQTVFFTATAMYFFIRAIQEKELRAMIFAGIVSAIGLLSYQATQLLPPLVLASLLLLTLTRIIPLRFALWGLAAYLLALATAAAPLIGNYLNNPYTVYSRADSVSALGKTGRDFLLKRYPPGTPALKIVHDQIELSLFAPISVPDSSPYLVNKLYGGMLDPAHAIFFTAGCLFLFIKIPKPAAVLLLFWTIVNLLAGSALTNNPPSYQRLIGVIPYLILIAAPMAYGAVERLSAALQLSAYGRNVLLVGAASLLLIASAHRYFHQIMAEPQYLEDSTRAARFLHKAGPTAYTYFFGMPYFYFEYGNIRFLAPEAKGENVPNPEEFLTRKISRRGPVIFMLIKANNRYVSRLRQSYPGGRETAHKDVHGSLLFTAYEVNL
ncbi:MAG: glycosyltransferase family 39 protein [Candidatus Omnitrophota bacterium]